MTFMLGSFTTGLASGAESMMKMEGQMNDLRDANDARSAAKGVKDMMDKGRQAGASLGGGAASAPGAGGSAGSGSGVTSTPLPPAVPDDLSHMPSPTQAVPTSTNAAPSDASSDHTGNSPPNAGLMTGRNTGDAQSRPYLAPNSNDPIMTAMGDVGMPAQAPAVQSGPPPAQGQGQPTTPAGYLAPGNMSTLNNQPVGRTFSNWLHGRPTPAYGTNGTVPAGQAVNTGGGAGPTLGGSVGRNVISVLGGAPGVAAGSGSGGYQ